MGAGAPEAKIVKLTELLTKLNACKPNAEPPKIQKMAQDLAKAEK